MDTRSTLTNSINSLDTVIEDEVLSGQDTDSVRRSIGPDSLRAQAATIESILCESPGLESDSDDDDEGDLPSHDVLYDDGDAESYQPEGEYQRKIDLEEDRAIDTTGSENVNDDDGVTSEEHEGQEYSTTANTRS